MKLPTYFQYPWARLQLWGLPSFVTSVQRGTVGINPATNSGVATITAVDLARAFCVIGGSYACQLAGTPAFLNHAYSYLTLTDATTVTAKDATGTYGGTVAWQAIEFAPGILKSVQAGTITAPAANDTGTATINQVVPERTLLIFNGFLQSDGGINDNNCGGRVDLTNPTTVTFVQKQNPAVNVPRFASYTVLEFY